MLINSTACGYICFSRYITPIALDIFLDIWSVCLFYFKFELKTMLRKLNWVTLSFSIIFRYSFGYNTLLWFVWNTIYLVFLIFSDSLFDNNHSLMLFNWRLISLSFMSLLIFQNKVVSSAYISILNIGDTRVKSLISNKNSNGLNIEPCGMPVLIC